MRTLPTTAANLATTEDTGDTEVKIQKVARF